MCIRLHLKYPPYFSICNENWISSEFFLNTQIFNFIKIRNVGAELFRADRRTEEYDEAKSRFSQFCESAYWKYVRIHTPTEQNYLFQLWAL